MDNPSEINAALAGVTIVERLEFRTDLATGRCSLVLELVDDHRRPAVRVALTAEGVSGMRVKRLGGGVSQLLCLRVEDVSSWQHEGVRYFLEDLEDQVLSLRWAKLTVRRVCL